MRKTKKAVASLAIAGMVLSMAPMSVFGATTDSNRLAGAGRVETAIAVANQGWANGADSVIVVPADDANIVDALAAAPLAGQLKAPILVTYKNALDPQVQQKIKDLGAKNVYAVGALSADTVASLKAISGVTVTALQGADRTETAAKVAAQLTNVKGSFVVAYNGTADALSAASFAAANGYSIVVSNPDGTIPASEKVVAPVYTVGGQAKYDGATKLAGADRYATNDAVNNGLTFKYDKVYVANGETLVDALAGAPLAAQTNSPIVLADATHAAKGVNDNLTDDSKVIALGGVGAVSDAVLGQVNKSNTGVVSVSSIKAATASSFKVKFTSAPADISKVTFTVKNGASPVTVTTSWNADKTEATLTSSAKFAPSTYTVSVKNDTKDLGSSDVTITEQKIAKIQITSTQLGVNGTGGDQRGYATYKILDQYDDDITDGGLANNVDFKTGVGDITAKDGLLTVTPSTGLNLLTFTGGVVITGNDSSTGVSTTATLGVTSQVGTLSDITLNKITNEDGKELTAGNTTDVFYIDYTAKDISGNETKNYTMLEQGIITNGTDHKLPASSPYVNVTLEKDPQDSSKGVIKVVATDKTVQLDMPLVINAMTWTGKTSQLNLTLKKQAEVAKFTLYAPSESIASDETKEIPFVAYDQNGEQVTKLSELKDHVTLTGAYWVENVDGTASVFNDKVTVSGNSSVPTVITAVVNSSTTGNYSSITINIQKAVKADELALDSKILVTAMQAGGAAQAVDFGWDDGGLTVKDQYGRDVNMREVGLNNYTVKVSSDDPAVATAKVVSVDENGNYIPSGDTLTNGKTKIFITSGQVGSTTIRFDLYEAGNKVDSKSQTISVLKNDDIKDYTIDEHAAPIYAVDKYQSDTITPRDMDWAQKLNIYGKTSGGARVVLNGDKAKVTTTVVDNYKDFMVTVPMGTDYAGDTPFVKVLATKLPDTRTTATTTVSATLLGVDNKYYTVKTALNSSSENPVAKSLEMNEGTEIPGIALNDIKDTVTVDLTNVQAANQFKTGDLLARFNDAGEPTNRSSIYFYAKDQYGKKAMKLGSIMKVKDQSSLTDEQFNVLPDGTITGTGAVKGYVTLTAVTNNGLQKTIKVVFNDATPAATTTTFAFDGPNAGKLMGSTTAMEYSLDNGTTWTAVASADQALAVGSISAANDIKVRVAAAGSVPAGAIQTIDVLAGPVAPTLTTFTAATGVLAGLPASAANLEYSVASDGTTYSAYAPLTVDATGNATLTGTFTATTSVVKVRVKAAGLTLPGAEATATAQ